MSRRPLIFWTGIALAAHLALFGLWRGSDSALGISSRLTVDLLGDLPERVHPPAPTPSPVGPSPAARPAPGSVSPPPDAPSVVRSSDSPAAPVPAAVSNDPPPMKIAPEPIPKHAAADSMLLSRPAEPEEDALASTVAPPAEADTEGGGRESETDAPMVVASPIYERNPPPAYPRLARERGWEGDVLLRVRVSRAGGVIETRVEQSSGHPILDRAAIRGVQSWRFVPGRRGPVPVDCEVLVPVEFKLKGDV